MAHYEERKKKFKRPVDVRYNERKNVSFYSKEDGRQVNSRGYRHQDNMGRQKPATEERQKK